MSCASEPGPVCAGGGERGGELSLVDMCHGPEEGQKSSLWRQVARVQADAPGHHRWMIWL